MTREEIGRIIRESRLATGLTQLQVAETLGRPQQTIAAWENGRSQPDANTLFELFRVLDRSVDEAFGFQKSNPPLSGRAIKLAQFFDELDEEGKEFLEKSIARERKRVHMDEITQSLQSFFDTFTLLNIYKTPISDKSGIDLAEEPERKIIQITKETPEDQVSTIRQVKMNKHSFGIRFHFDSGKEIIYAIDRDSVAENGQTGMFTINGKSFLKRLENDGLYPVQPGYEPIPKPGMLQCAGRVIGWFGLESIKEKIQEAIYY